MMKDRPKWSLVLLLGLALVVASSFTGCHHPSPPVIDEFGASLSEITAGESITLEWSVINATTITIDQGIGPVARQGSLPVSPSSTTAYTLAASNDVAAVTKSVVITVREVPLPHPIPKDESSKPPPTDESIVLVTRVIGGDTIEISSGAKVRYIGIDTRETAHPSKPLECFGKEAREKNRQLVEGKLVRLEKDISETDRYGRLLRYVWVEDIFVNEHLVRQGYAYAYTYPPDVKYAELFAQAQREARENNRGLWAVC